MLIKIKSGTIVDGRMVPAGAIIDVEPALAHRLVLCGQSERHSEGARRDMEAVTAPPDNAPKFKRKRGR